MRAKLYSRSKLIGKESTICRTCGKEIRHYPHMTYTYCSNSCRGKADRKPRPRQAIALRLTGLSWVEVAERLGYANGRVARLAAIYAAKDNPELHTQMKGNRPRYSSDEERRLVNRARESARRARYRIGNVTAADMKALLVQAHRCPLCSVRLVEDGTAPDGKQIDHIVPLVAGGAHSITNLRVICRHCNHSRPQDTRDLAGQQLALGMVV